MAMAPPSMAMAPPSVEPSDRFYPFLSPSPPILLPPPSPPPPDSLLPPPKCAGSSRHLAAPAPDVPPPPHAICRKRPFYSAFESPEEILENETMGECIRHAEKRGRRLSAEQVRALENAFDVDNKLEPERKVQLATQLALQERQVSVWFQNRRARWKTKQMERDYNALKKKLESLKADRDELIKEKEKLAAEVIRLKRDVVNKDKDKVKLEPTAEGEIPWSKISSTSVALRECGNEAVIWSPDQKERDGSSITEDSDGNAIDNADSASRAQRSFGDMAMQADLIGLLDLPEHHYGKLLSGLRGIKGEEVFSDVENGNGFLSLDWWEAS